LQPSLHHVLPDGRVGTPARGAAGRHTSEIRFNLKHLSKGGAEESATNTVCLSWKTAA